MSTILIHLTTLALTATLILYADHLGFAYFRGSRSVLSKTVLKRLHTLIWVGLTGMIVSGGFLAAPVWEYLITEPAFILKMAFVIVLVINALVIDRMFLVATERPFVELSLREKRILLVSGALSAIGWIGAATIGFFFL